MGSASSVEHLVASPTVVQEVKKEQEVTDNVPPVSPASQQPKRKNRHTSYGHFTKTGMVQYAKLFPNEPFSDNAESLQGSEDPNTPLYYWQLYSVLGTRRIEAIVSEFYSRVFSDQDPTHSVFVHAFERIGPLERHVGPQLQFWLDAMGAGKYYHGGDFRVNFHHKNNARQVMNTESAAIWMQHMSDALDSFDLETVDSRVRRTVDTFLYCMMEKYATDFRFSTGERVYGSRLLASIGKLSA